MGSRNQVLDGGSRSDEFVCSLKQGVKLRQCTLYYVIFMLNYFGHFFLCAFAALLGYNARN